MNIFNRLKSRILILLTGIVLIGCQSTPPIKPDELSIPDKLTCFDLPTPITVTKAEGPFKIVWDTIFTNGPYVSERVSDDGTYFRAPPGGIFIGRPDKIR